MNIVFLDVDGVINSRNKLIEVYKKTGKPHSLYNYPFDELCLNYLKEIIEETNSFIVVTSTWRKDEEGKKILLEELDKYGLLNRVIGYTEILNTTRGLEIKSYLEKNKNIINFIILDDDTTKSDLDEFLIKINGQTGITSKEKDEAIKRLKAVK